METLPFYHLLSRFVCVIRQCEAKNRRLRPPPSKMKNNYLHTGNTTKKSSARARPVFRAFGVVAAVTLAGVGLAAGPEHLGAQSSKSQIVAENPDASNNHGIATSGIGFRTTTASVDSQTGN